MTMRLPVDASAWRMAELVFDGPDQGNPFTEVELTAEIRGPQGRRRVVGGFYDGLGVYRIRFLPDLAGEWSFRSRSNVRSLEGLDGVVEVAPALPHDRGPVRVDRTYHFAHADGTRYLPVGTTAYAWTHQTEDLQKRTLATLSASPFNKVKMCAFPKSYLFNTNEPPHFPFEGSVESGWDLTRFNPVYFRVLERRIADLNALGIQADLILFHAYDRWGFSTMDPVSDDRYVRYLVRRLAAYPSVWWALANEWDLLQSKSREDWERIARVVAENDPVGHLTSIHNCREFYDHSRPWITHCSIQRVDVYRTAENTDQWRQRWRKPIVVDECAYEGDIDQGWGNISGEELTRRAWEGAVRGGYVAHGETYLNRREELWWSKGGDLVGTSPPRFGFLRQIIAEAPRGCIDPLPSDWDVPWGGDGDEYRIAYFGFGRPRFRIMQAPPMRRYTVDVIDTWAMTVSRLPGEHEGTFKVELPGRPYMAVRLIAAES